MGKIVLVYGSLADLWKQKWQISREDLHKTRTLPLLVHPSSPGHLDTMRLSTLLPISSALISMAFAAPLLGVSS
jgi:hypothetical protein